MSDERKPAEAGLGGAGAPDQAGSNEANGPNGPRAGEDTAAAAAMETPQLEAIVKALQDEIAALNDTNLRLRAEMENLRRRFEREKSDTAKYAITKFAQDVVNVGDNFQRAISAVPAEAAEQDAALKSFLDGVVIAEREFINVLQRHGVVRLEPVGEPFNPKIHNAVMEQERPDVPTGTVLQVFQAGYLIEDRCLKPAMVVVSRGGPKPGKAEPTAASSSPDESTTGNEAGNGAGGAA